MRPMDECIDMRVKVYTPYIWYRNSTKEWVVNFVIKSRDVAECVIFSAKKKNKAKKRFVKFCCDGVLGDEFLSRFKNNEIHILEEQI